MKQQRMAIAHKVAEQLFATETAIDTALAAAATLAALMPSVRADANLSALMGQDALDRAIAAVASLGVARREIVETHRELSVTQKQMGLGTVAFGGWVEKPPAQAALTVVPNAVAA